MPFLMSSGIPLFSIISMRWPIRTYPDNKKTQEGKMQGWDGHRSRKCDGLIMVLLLVDVTAMEFQRDQPPPPMFAPLSSFLTYFTGPHLVHHHLLEGLLHVSRLVGGPGGRRMEEKREEADGDGSGHPPLPPRCFLRKGRSI